jgi:hypothetical protein
MTRLSQKRLILLGGVLAVCALAPSMASAAGWGPLGTTHLLTATNLRFDAHVVGIGVGGAFCTDTRFHADVRDAARLTITNATFGTCHGTGLAVDCTPTMAATNFPWTATGASTSNITIEGVQVDIHFTNRPGDPNSCIAPSSVTSTGHLGGGLWDAAAHQVTYTNTTGLTAHIPGFGPAVETTSGTLRDLTQSLTLT